jgi:DNA-binding NtrC family response regulator
MSETLLTEPTLELLERDRAHRPARPRPDLGGREAPDSDRSDRIDRADSRLTAPPGLGEMIGRSPAMRDLFRRLERASRGDGPVLIEGETGVGKRLAARTLHALSLPARDGAVSTPHPFLTYDPQRSAGRPGGLDAAIARAGGARGTLFIREVGDLTAAAQRELLRLLAAGRRSSFRAGGTVRVVCTSSRSLRPDLERGAFHEDLHAQLRVCVLPVPSVRDRREDLPLLLEHFLREAGRRHGRRVAGVSAAAMDLLAAHPWEGNVRELAAETERAVLLTADGRLVEPAALSPDILSPGAPRTPRPGSLKLRARELEKRVVARALAKNGWNVAATARELGISRVGLSKKLKVLDLRRPERSPRG